jgi:hypothetical protein
MIATYRFPGPTPHSLSSCVEERWPGVASVHVEGHATLHTPCPSPLTEADAGRILAEARPAPAIDFGWGPDDEGQFLGHSWD